MGRLNGQVEWAGALEKGLDARPGLQPRLRYESLIRPERAEQNAGGQVGSIPQILFIERDLVFHQKISKFVLKT